jgi:hypothetical protein
MMKPLMNVVGLGAALVLCGAALAQVTPDGKSDPFNPKTDVKPKADPVAGFRKLTLDELCALALKHNPTIRAADSKVKEAQAALDYARSQILTLIAEAHHELQSARELDAEAQKRLDIELRLGGVGSERELSDSRLTRVRTKLELAKAEGALMTLVGVIPKATSFNPAADAADLYRQAAAAPAAPAQLPDAVRKALDTKVTVEFQDAPAAEVIAHLQDLIQGVNLHLAANANIKERKMTLRLKEKVPVAGVLQWLEDAFEVKCVLRDYGIVVADRNVVPPGAILLLDAWRKQPSK